MSSFHSSVACLLSTPARHVFCPRQCGMYSVHSSAACVMSMSVRHVFCPLQCGMYSFHSSAACVLSTSLRHVFCPHQCGMYSVHSSAACVLSTLVRHVICPCHQRLECTVTVYLCWVLYFASNMNNCYVLLHITALLFSQYVWIYMCVCVVNSIMFVINVFAALLGDSG